jgi:hypothetical protein
LTKSYHCVTIKLQKNKGYSLTVSPDYMLQKVTVIAANSTVTFYLRGLCNIYNNIHLLFPLGAMIHPA